MKKFPVLKNKLSELKQEAIQNLKTLCGDKIYKFKTHPIFSIEDPYDNEINRYDINGILCEDDQLKFITEDENNFEESSPKAYLEDLLMDAFLFTALELIEIHDHIMNVKLTEIIK